MFLLPGFCVGACGAISSWLRRLIVQQLGCSELANIIVVGRPIVVLEALVIKDKPLDDELT